MSLLLAIETSTPYGSVCFMPLERSGDVQKANWQGGHREGGLFKALARHRDLVAQTKVVAVGLGPGNFSGIRIALATARGIQAVNQCALFGICSADAVALELTHVTRLGVFADAKRVERYLTIYERGEKIEESKTISNAQVEIETSKLTLAVSAEPLDFVPERAWPLAERVGQLALQRWQMHPAGDQHLEPVYLREAVISGLPNEDRREYGQ